MQWFEVSLSATPFLKETFTNRLFELGAEGVQDVDESNLTAYFPTEKQAEVTESIQTFMASIAELFPEASPAHVHFRTIAQEAWADKYKEHYFPQPLTRLFYLKPSWNLDAPVPEGMIPIRMDPGQAFGTGLHPSTQLSLRLIERTVDRHPDPSGLSLLDVGTGSGILAIAAKKLGLQRVVGIDNDPLAVDTASENAKINDCPGIALSGGPIQEQPPGFDIVVANILFEAHRELAREYVRCLRPGGQLILAGLLGHQKGDLDLLFTALGFRSEIAETQQEWLAVSYRLRNS